MVQIDMMEIKRQLITVCKILDTEKVTDELGHVSVRIPNTDHILINGKVSPGQATIEDITTVDLDGKHIDGTLEAPGETPLHISIYKRRQDVFAIAHTHSPMVVILSTLGIKLKPICNTAAFAFSEELPMYEKYGLISTHKLGDDVADLLGSYPAIVLKWHGNAVVGSSLEECCVRAIWIEKAAGIQYQAMGIGVPELVPKRGPGKLTEEARAGAIKRSWDYFEWKTGRSSPSSRVGN